MRCGFCAKAGVASSAMPSADKIGLEVFMIRFSYSSVALATLFMRDLAPHKTGTINPNSRKSNMNQYINENFTDEFMAFWCIAS